jgi:hypothetical protein
MALRPGSAFFSDFGRELSGWQINFCGVLAWAQKSAVNPGFDKVILFTLTFWPESFIFLSMEVAAEAPDSWKSQKIKKMVFFPEFSIQLPVSRNYNCWPKCQICGEIRAKLVPARPPEKQPSAPAGLN